MSKRYNIQLHVILVVYVEFYGIILQTTIADQIYSLGRYDGTETWSYINPSDKTKGVQVAFTNGGM
jgi:hypothetical protein